MKYTVVHSKDPYLLARLATDLQMSGVKVDLGWCEGCESHPFTYFKQEYLHTCDPNGLQFFPHDSCYLTKQSDRHELTESNYLQVLESVLS